MLKIVINCLLCTLASTKLDKTAKIVILSQQPFLVILSVMRQKQILWSLSIRRTSTLIMTYDRYNV